MLFVVLLAGCGGTRCRTSRAKRRRPVRKSNWKRRWASRTSLKGKVRIFGGILDVHRDDGDVNFTLINDKIQGTVTIPKERRKEQVTRLVSEELKKDAIPL